MLLLSAAATAAAWAAQLRHRAATAAAVAERPGGGAVPNSAVRAEWRAMTRHVVVATAQQWQQATPRFDCIAYNTAEGFALDQLRAVCYSAPPPPPTPPLRSPAEIRQNGVRRVA